LASADRIHILGRDFDEEGNLVRGAHFIEDINLLDLGLVWQENIRELPQFNTQVNEIEDLFKKI